MLVFESPPRSMCRHPERETVWKSSRPGEGEGEEAVTAGIESSVGQSHAAAPLFCASVNECDPEEAQHGTKCTFAS